MGSVFGEAFRITTWGESHGPGVGVVIDGCPAGLPIERDHIQHELDRRRPGQSRLSSPRQESDEVQILSGIFAGCSTGTPISLSVHNKDARPGAYDELRELYRPSHADYTYQAKYGRRDWRGGGRASARETVGRVAAGAVARRFLAEAFGVEICAWVSAIADLEAEIEAESVSVGAVDAHPVRCPDPVLAAQMAERIDRARREGDSLGGTVSAVARAVPAGWGEPVFDKLEAMLAHAMLSIPASKGFEIGSGFAGTRLTGATHNDAFYVDQGRVRTRTNRSGGVQGGISNGEDLLFRVAFKPTPTIRRDQETVNHKGESVVFSGRGRHDPCVLPRAVPVVEAMAALVLADCALRQRRQGR